MISIQKAKRMSLSVTRPAVDHVLAYALEFLVDVDWPNHFVGWSQRVLKGVGHCTDRAVLNGRR